MGRIAQPGPTETDFAVEAAGGTTGTLFATVYGGAPPSRLLAVTDHFAVLADVSPLVAGHVLVVPQLYLPSFGAIPPGWWSELDELIHRTSAAVNDAYGPASLIEHGSSSRPARSPCISHAHVHVLPIAARLDADAEERGLRVQTLGSMRELRWWARRDRSYLCWKAPGGPCRAADVEDAPGIPRQHLRRQLAAQTADGHWDWALPPRRELLRDTVTRLRPALNHSDAS